MSEKAAAIGFTMFWGYSPAINIFAGSNIDPNADEEINVLLA